MTKFTEAAFLARGSACLVGKRPAPTHAEAVDVGIAVTTTTCVPSRSARHLPTLSAAWDQAGSDQAGSDQPVR